MQHLVLVTIGAITITTAWGGLYLNFVKPGLRWWLILAGALVLIMGAHGVLTGDAPLKSDPEHAEDHAEDLDAHQAHHDSRIGWLLLVPFVVLSVVVPPPLGSFSAERDSGAVRSSSANGSSLPPLKASAAPVMMTLADYSVRAVFDEGRTLQSNRVRLVGFVSSRRVGKSGPSWYLTRMAMSCCAADGYAIKIDVRGGDRLPNDTWVAVTGRWVRSAGSIDAPETLAAVQIESMQTVTAPARTYE
jgi:uncharacterized repeat protein (TIGR03943 family)